MQQTATGISIHPFVFSNNRQYRLARHATFWVTWILYYSAISAISYAPKFGYAKSFFYNLTVVTLSTPLDMAFCYFIIYFLLPRFLFKGQYVTMLLLWLLASFTELTLFEGNAYYVVPYISRWFDFPEPMLPKKISSLVYDVFNLFSQLNMEGCVAASIKLGKLWYVKQQEIDLLKQENEKIKPHEEEGLMPPAFMADLLVRLEALADTKPLLVAQSVKKLRNLFTYMLYENAQAKALLKKELQIASEYVELEQLMASEELVIGMHNNVHTNGETIAPFIILPFIENAFRQVYMQSLATRQVAITIDLQQGLLHISIGWSKPADTSTLAEGRNVIMQNVSRRLQLIYPQSHELTTYLEVERVRVELLINLKKAIN